MTNASGSQSQPRPAWMRHGKNKKKKPQGPSKWVKRAGAALKIASRVSSLLIQLRAKPRWYDYFALASGVLDEGMSIWQLAQEKNINYAYAFLQENGLRKQPNYLIDTLFKFVEGHRMVDSFTPAEGHEAVWTGNIGSVPIFWQGKDATSEPWSIWLNPEDEDRVMEELSRVIWQQLPTHVSFGIGGRLVDDVVPLEGIIETKLTKDLRERVGLFLKTGEPRGYLLEGPPGAGKTTAIQQLIQSSNLRSLRVELSAFSANINSNANFFEFAPSVDTLIRILKPEVLIIDDADRVSMEDQAQLLKMFETAHSFAKMILVSVNDKTELLLPLMRPGRLDDHIFTGGIDTEVLKSLVGDEDSDLFDTMKTWPIAYVVDYVKRRKVLGRDKARSEVPELDKRSKFIGKTMAAEAALMAPAIGFTADGF